MTTTQQLPKRLEVPSEMTWDLTTMFATDEAFNEALASFSSKIATVKAHQGKLKEGPSALLEAIEAIASISREFELLYVYSHLKNDQDTTNTAYQAMHAQASSLSAQVNEAMSWFEPELLQLSDDEIWRYFEEEAKLTEYSHFIETIISERPHILTEKEEALLAGASEIFGASSKAFSILNNADFKFPTVTNEEGQEVQLSHGLYGQLLESTNAKVREEAFKGMYSVYQQFQNTLATTLSNHVKGHNYKATVRNYSSAREAALSANHIPESVYDTLISVVRNNLPSLHRYVALRKKLLGLDALHMYDMYTPILGEAQIRYSYEEAKEKSLEALKPMGEEYLAIVKEAYDSRWIDVVENQGKRSGAYSSGCYDSAPYILMNWHDSLDQMYTLVHEMGHSVHSYLTRNNQPYMYGDYSIFLAEIASTTNENLLTEYLLETETDPQVRAYVLNRYLDGFKGTIFRQTQFAEFEHFIHTEDAKGVPLTSDYLNEYYGNLNEIYYGAAVEKDPEIAVEWSRIPHFYYNYYVYQYSTGFSAASALAEKIISEEEGALDKYLTFLKAGSSDYPIEVMKKAGVDMTSPTYIEEAMAVFNTRLAEFEELVASFN
ncbi:oligoendopeptidase F [Vagococcus intermedius]|uniref:Oligopeptidase F n=1 Tax=Vagococcus intermedius TaxID=2991418 RepID=A0AAF0I9S4_9ENTE|nr:oligoendopeptidase F [Vagococcus intermedius]WEG73697.1 oligoendopeptidase F [Vagococcus intermedius]WEG75781.1 oligoendopeptidase F [Vagococcus intermedius]